MLIMDDVNHKYFNNEAKVIYIGGGLSKRSFLNENISKYSDKIEFIDDIIYSI